MWKSFFLAVGIFLIILGAETLIVDKFVMSDGNRVSRAVAGSGIQDNGPRFLNAGYGKLKREITTKDWMPWSLLAAGAITVMYTCSLHNRNSDSE
jgi:hypothetical protein